MELVVGTRVKDPELRMEADEATRTPELPESLSTSSSSVQKACLGGRSFSFLVPVTQQNTLACSLPNVPFMISSHHLQ